MSRRRQAAGAANVPYCASSGIRKCLHLFYFTTYLLCLPPLLSSVLPRFGGATYMYFKDLTLVPIQTKMIDLDLLLPAEEEWMDKYHKQVWAVQLVWQVWSSALTRKGRGTPRSLLQHDDMSCHVGGCLGGADEQVPQTGACNKVKRIACPLQSQVQAEKHGCRFG